MRRFFLACCLLGVTACSTASPLSGPVDREVVLAIGQSAPITTAALTLKFLGVPADTRCPSDALCLLPGSASVDVQVTAFSGGTRIVRFETGDPKPAEIGTLTVDLVQLAPYPSGPSRIDPADYRATLRVRR